MTPATPPAPPQSMTSPAPTSGANAQRRRVVPAIPLQYPRAGTQKRNVTKARSQEVSILAGSDNNGLSSGEDGQTSHAIVQDPMTPESLSSSLHRAHESLSDQETVHSQKNGGEEFVTQHSSELSQENGANGIGEGPSALPRTETSNVQAVPSLPIEEPAATSTASAWTKPARTNGVKAKNGFQHSDGYQQGLANTNGQGIYSKEPQKPFKALRIPQELPPEFYPSEFSPPPHSGAPSSVDLPPFVYYPASRPVHIEHPMPHNMAHKKRGQNLSFNPEAHFQPVDRRANNLSRTPSHGSSAGQAVNGFDLQSPLVPRTPSNFFDPKLSSSFELQNHMLGQFEQSLYTDSTIDISGLTDSPERQKIKAHIVLLVRSPTFRMLAANSDFADRAFVVEANRFMNEFGFLSAIRYMYGAPLLSINDFLHELSQANFSSLQSNGPSARIMSDVLGYIASGVYLELPPVIGAGLELARHVQRWDTVPMALAFALDGGLPSAWSAPRGNDEPASESTFGPAGSQLLFDTLHFMSTNFPPHFHFSDTASQLEQLPRLPTVIEARPSMANPRLSLIQFGSLAIEDTGRPDSLTTLLSSILLSLPFAALKFFIEHDAFHPQGTTRFELAQAVVRERESRRLKVLHAKRVKEPREQPIWEATRWHEKVADDDHVFPGFHIFRVLADQNTRPKS